MRTILGAVGFAALVLAGCASESATPSDPDPAPASSSTSTTTEALPPAPFDRLPTDLRLIALGDSYTEGTSIPPEGSWPLQLAAARGARGSVDVEVVAGDGWNSKRLDRELDRAWDGSTYELVVVGVGANDVVLPFGIDNFREGLDAIVADIADVSAEDAVVVMLSIPDFRASPWGQERLDREYDIEPYNEVLASYAAGIDALFVDVTTASGATVGDPTMFADDDLHFSAVQYAVWVDLILEALS